MLRVVPALLRLERSHCCIPAERPWGATSAFSYTAQPSSDGLDLGLVTDLQMSLPAETALECASSFYKYGAALFWKAQDESDILGNQVQAAAARKDAAAQSQAAQQSGEEEDSEEDEEEEEETDGELGELAHCRCCCVWPLCMEQTLVVRHPKSRHWR